MVNYYSVKREYYPVVAKLLQAVGYVHGAIEVDDFYNINIRYENQSEDVLIDNVMLVARLYMLIKDGEV